MPAGIIQGENAQEVAAFVGAYAGQAGSDSEPLVDTDDPRSGPTRPRPGVLRRGRTHRITRLLPYADRPCVLPNRVRLPIWLARTP